MDNDAQKAAEALGDRLLGSCTTAECEPEWEEYSNNDDFCTRLDDKVMCCETCGWWVETHDIDDDGNCSDCSER